MGSIPAPAPTLEAMAEANIRVINITLNPFELRNEDSNFEIRCGENVRLVFSLPKDVGDLQLTESGTLQVEAINALNGFKALAKEGTYTVGALSELNAQIDFNSSQTAYGATQAGAYNLVVALKDASGNIVLSGVVPFNLYNVGYDGIVEPPEDFRDEVLEAADKAQAAATQAQQSATSATGSATSAKADAESAKQSSESANSSSQAAINSAENAGISAASASSSATAAQQSANAAQTAAEHAQQISDPNNIIGSLQVSKANTGMLYFTGRPYGTNNLMSVGELFSVAYRTDFQFASGSATSNQYKLWSIGSNTAYIAPAALSDDLLRISYNGSGFYSFKGANIRAAVQDINSIVAIVNNPTGGNITITLYVNGVQIPQNSYTARAAQTFTGYRVNTQGGTPSLIDTTIKDFAVFNFDMSAGGAPYSVADYSAGKPVPPSALAQTAVLLENYTFTVGSTQYIPDVSGNNNDATITGTGTVAGTFDKAIAKLASLITSTNA